MPRSSLPRIVLAVVTTTSVLLGLTALVPSASYAASHQGASSASGTGRSITLQAPSSSAQGDTQVVVVATKGTRTSLRAPQGWRKVAERHTRRGSNARDVRVAVFTSTQAGAATFRLGHRTAWQAVRTAYRGVTAKPRVRLTRIDSSAPRLPHASTTTGGFSLTGIAAAGTPRKTRFTSSWTERHDRTTRAGRLSLAVADRKVSADRQLTPRARTSRSARALAFTVVVPRKATAAVGTPERPSTGGGTLPGVGGILASIAESAGTPWRAGHASQPGFANHVLDDDHVADSGETAVIRSLSGIILNIDEYTEPVYYRSMASTSRPVKCTMYGCIGGNRAPITGRELVAPGSDGQLILVDLAGRRSYELWAVQKDADGTVKINSDGSVSAGSMSVVDLDGRGNHTAEGRNLNITGAGLSRMFGLIRSNEVRAARTNPRTAIPHALQVSLPSTMNCSNEFRAPATKTDGRATSSRCVAEGARFRLDPSYDCTSVSTRMGKAVCFALQKYGAYNMDNAGSRSMIVYGQHQRSWSGGQADYRAVGIEGDYQNLGLPISRMSSLRSWTGR